MWVYAMAHQNKMVYLLHKYNILCTLGQACNHIAALFFIEHHVDDSIVPTEISDMKAYDYPYSING